MAVIGKLMIPAVVNAINCADCPLFQINMNKRELDETATHAENMIKNNVCHKRDAGSCQLGLVY